MSARRKDTRRLVARDVKHASARDIKRAMAITQSGEAERCWWMLQGLEGMDVDAERERVILESFAQELRAVRSKHGKDGANEGVARRSGAEASDVAPQERAAT